MTDRQAWTLDPKLAQCDECPWEVAYPTTDAALAASQRHKQHAHGVTIPPNNPWTGGQPVTQLASVDWWTRAMEAIAAQPAGTRFTLYEVCKHLDEPPAANGWQNLARDAHHLGLIRKLGGVESQRQGTRKSMTGYWERTSVNPVRERRVG